jgi:hypothetical protein
MQFVFDSEFIIGIAADININRINGDYEWRLLTRSISDKYTAIDFVVPREVMSFNQLMNLLHSLGTVTDHKYGHKFTLITQDPIKVDNLIKFSEPYVIMSELRSEASD